MYHIYIPAVAFEVWIHWDINQIYCTVVTFEVWLQWEISISLGYASASN